MKSTAKTPEEYLASVGGERESTLRALRKLIVEVLPAGYEESINWGMICYQVPLSTYPNTYNGQPVGLVALANQKNYLSLYLSMPDVKHLKELASKAGKKLKAGKSCINFTKLDDLPLDEIKGMIQKNDLKTFLAAVGAAQGRPLPAEDKVKPTAPKKTSTKKALAKVAAKKATPKVVAKPSAKRAAPKKAAKKASAKKVTTKKASPKKTATKKTAKKPAKKKA